MIWAFQNWNLEGGGDGGVSFYTPWFSAGCAAEIAHRNHFLQMYQQNKLAMSNAKSRLVIDGNQCKRGFESTGLIYAYKTGEIIVYQKHAFCDFCRIANSVFKIGKSAIPW